GDELTDKARYGILNGLLTRPGDEDNREYPQKWWDQLTQQVLQLKLNSIQEQIKKHEKAEKYEYVEKVYGALQQALARHAEPQGVEAMLSILTHYQGGFNYGVLADDLLIKLLKQVILSKNMGAINRLIPLFKSSPQILNHELDSGIHRALAPKTAMPNPLYALSLHQLRPDPQSYYLPDQQQSTAPLKSLTTEGMTLKDILANKPPSRHMETLFCQLVQQKFAYEAEQLLLANRSFYSAISHQNRQLCSLDLAIQLRSQSMVNHIFTTLQPPQLISALLRQSAHLK
ncbi:MAG: hypothetical protein ACPG47_10465, partial [Leucothrix sp.]